MARRVIILCVLFALAAVAPASAQLQRPADVLRIESAMSELGKQKNAAEGQVKARERAATAALAACRTKGSGWKRIRGVRDRAQRNAYARGAKALWQNLNTVAIEGAWVDVYGPFFERFLHHFDTPLSDPILQAGIDAQGQRVAYNRASSSFGTCATFNTALKKVREFKIGGEHGVSGDYYAGKIYNDFVRYVSNRQRAAARSLWGARYDNALDAASAQLKALGGNEGLANYFRFAFRG
jgi:hypothetical protein